MPQLWPLPALMALKTSPPLTATGLGALAAPPLPSWLLVLVPQQNPAPAGSSAQEWPVPAETSCTGKITPVACKVTEATPERDAVSVLGPASSPKLQLPTVAMPAASVVAFAPLTAPPPLATTNTTTTPGSGCPTASLSLTAGAM